MLPGATTVASTSARGAVGAGAGRPSHFTVLLPATLASSLVFLGLGLTVCSVDLDEYSWGLYLILVAVVGLIISLAFCIVGPEDESQTPAKAMWTRVTVKSSSVFGRPGRRSKRCPTPPTTAPQLHQQQQHQLECGSLLVEHDQQRLVVLLAKETDV